MADDFTQINDGRMEVIQMNLGDVFVQLLRPYCITHPERAMQFWSELGKAYSAKSRWYHNLQHLEQMLGQLLPLRTEFQNWDAALFALFYHDAVYSSVRSDNEEKSAELAADRLQQIDVPAEVINFCVQHILATKGHQVSADNDTNLFTDADLSVLGADAATYRLYAANIRKEYRLYPDALYRPGRRKVLKHFLAMDRIFKTEYFFNRFEAQAKINLQGELEMLQ